MQSADCVPCSLQTAYLARCSLQTAQVLRLHATHTLKSKIELSLTPTFRKYVKLISLKHRALKPCTNICVDDTMENWRGHHGNRRGSRNKFFPRKSEHRKTCKPVDAVAMRGVASQKIGLKMSTYTGDSFAR